MIENDIKLIVQKTITGERARATGLTSSESLIAIRYILYDIMKLEEDEIPRIFSIDFLDKYDIRRFYRLITPPMVYSRVKLPYILSILCPNIVSFDGDYEIWKRYLLTIKDKSKPTFWAEFHEASYIFKVVRKLLPIIFSIDSLEDLFTACRVAKDSFYETIKLFRLDDFYDEFCICLPDFVWLSFTDAEKMEYLKPYLKERIKYPLGLEYVVQLIEQSDFTIEELKV